ncbi:MAG TPA: hypothetical protein VFN23_03820 [Ktedonobacteraceae bacterium]|nr:hypothetical protein [Ktedonobacteraceae bacterium]
MPLYLLSPDSQHIHPDSVRFYQNSLEDAIHYQRLDGHKVEIVLNHFLAASGDVPPEPTLTLASFRQRKNPNMNPSEQIELSMEEARLLRDFLNREDITAWLNAD